MVGPRPAWQRVLRVTAAVVAVLLAVSLGTVVVATLVNRDRDRSMLGAAPPGTTTPAPRPGSPALQACQATHEAFYAPRPEQGAAFGRAALLMQGAAGAEPRYEPAVEALRWFQIHMPTGVLYSVEADPGSRRCPRPAPRSSGPIRPPPRTGPSRTADRARWP